MNDDPPTRPATDQAGTLRILDANANRATEALRVVEEHLRFVLEDRHLTALCKQLRHDLTAVLASLRSEKFPAVRDTIGDVGTDVETPAEYRREGTSSIVTANQKRAEQALRVLEEYAKAVDPAAAAKIEQLRYRAYTLGKAVATTTASRQHLADARLYVLVDGRDSAETFGTLVQQLVEAGVDVLQLRDKQLSDRELLQRARQLHDLTRDVRTLFIMNDRPDLAILAVADGVHVGQDELTAQEVRAIIGPDKLIGVSTHSIEQARQAVLDGADYIGCGPTFPSGTKQFDSFPGLTFLKEVADEISLPAFAIGGITLYNVADVQTAGFGRVAVAGAISQSREPATVARQLSTVLESATGDG